MVRQVERDGPGLAINGLLLVLARNGQTVLRVAVRVVPGRHHQHVVQAGTDLDLDRGCVEADFAEIHTPIRRLADGPRRLEGHLRVVEIIVDAYVRGALVLLAASSRKGADQKNEREDLDRCCLHFSNSIPRARQWHVFFYRNTVTGQTCQEIPGSSCVTTCIVLVFMRYC